VLAGPHEDAAQGVVDALDRDGLVIQLGDPSGPSRHP